ncbi:hypothetical protein IX83_00475 [Basilea psittacipulmonis DSM 24701]|uniref:Type III pantothenate kinase n=1 Tax=Basilea psittacipulmonis DSM 24701 TaxID=1072685 RepID=A0A077DAS0_9BURK|nr:hypothetical protein IX83_00475 [Basilea psittacipulmonis DSM 24701]
MDILIDAGNSRIKVCFVDSQNETPQSYLVINHIHIDELKKWVADLPDLPKRAFGVNVAGQVIKAQIESMMPCPVKWLKSEPQTLCLTSAYRHEQLGADRWYALLGLRWHCPKDVAMLVSMGTATTIDSISEANEFLGGLILPGTLMMTKSLHSGTANLPQVRVDKKVYFPPDFPVNTVDAIRSGIIAAQCGAILRQWQALKSYYAQKGVVKEPKIYLSGGARHDIIPELKQQFLRLEGYEPVLSEIRFPVLDGLRFYASKISADGVVG